MSIVKKVKKAVKTSNLLDMDILTISNFLCNEAIRRYVIEFKTKKVPFTFIEFFHNKLSNLESIKADSFLIKFFEETKKENLDIPGFVYFLTFPEIVKTIKQLRSGEFMFVLFSKKPPLSMKYRIKNNQKIEKSLDLLIDIMANLEVGVEKSVGGSFLTWKAQNPFIFKSVFNKTEEISAEPQKTQAQTPGQSIQNPDDYELEGPKISIPHKGNEKVHRLFIPKLPLPSAYPKGEKNRIHTGYHVNNLLSPSKMLNFLSHHRIVSVSYTKSFFDLRFEAIKPEERKWSDLF